MLEVRAVEPTDLIHEWMKDKTTLRIVYNNLVTPRPNYNRWPNGGHTISHKKPKKRTRYVKDWLDELLGLQGSPEEYEINETRDRMLGLFIEKVSFTDLRASLEMDPNILYAVLNRMRWTQEGPFMIMDERTRRVWVIDNLGCNRDLAGELYKQVMGV